MGGSAGSSSSSSSGSGFEDLSSTYTPNPQAMAAYNQTLNMAENLAQNPYTPYTGQMIAGFTPEQMAAFQGVRNMQGYMQPYINAGTNAEQAALAYSNPANYTVQSVGQYYNPYQQSVIQSTQNLMNQQNAMQQGQLLGQANTQAGGAAFNDRTGIAQAALAGQQALANNQTLANLEQQGFQQAQQEYNQQQQQAVGANQAAAYGIGQLGTMGQQGNLGELQALLGTGGQQQQLAQQQLSGAYQQWLNAQAWPYQQTAFLADIAAGIGPSMGGTTNTVGFGSNQGQTQSSSASGSGGASQLGGLLSMLPAMFAKDGGYIDDRSHLATGGTGTTATTGTSTSKGGLGSLLSSIASQDVGGTTSASPSTSASSDPTQLSNTGFGNIGYTPASYLDPNYQTGLNALFDPQTAAQVAESKWTSGHYDQPQQSQQQYPEPQAARHGGRIGYADGGNPNILPDLQNIYGNPLFKGFGSLIDNKTMPYSGQPLPTIHGTPSPHPQTPSLGFIPHGPAHVPSGGGGGGGGEGGGGGGGKPPKAPETNPNKPLKGDTPAAGGDGGPSPSIVSTPEAPAMSLVGPSMDTPSGESIGYSPDTVGDTGMAALPSSPDIPLMAGGLDFGGFADGGRVGYAGGGAPAPAMGSSGGLGNLGTYAPSDLSPLDIAPETTGINTTDPFGASHGGNKSFSDLANQWISNHIIAEDPTPQSKGFPGMAPQTSTPQPRPELPSQEMIDTAGMTNLGNGINPGVAALFGGADPMEALMLVGSQPSGAQAGAPFGGASSSDLASQRAQLLATPQPAAGYAQGNLDYGRMTPEGLFGMTPVGYYTEPLYAKGGRVHKEGGGSLLDRIAAGIAAVESSGHRNPYAISGARSKSGDYPYGKYQIMGANIPKWGAEAGYPGLTIQQFRNSPQIQEAVARNQFQKILNKSGGNPMAVAGEWIGGPGWRTNTHRDALGTSVPGYQKKFAAAFGNPNLPAQPTGYAGVANPAAMAATARKVLGGGPVAMDYMNLQPISGAAPSGSNLNRINKADPSGPLLPLGNDSGNPVTQRVANNSKMIAQPPAQRRGISLSDFNPVGSAQARELAGPMKWPGLNAHPFTQAAAPAPAQNIGLQDFGQPTKDFGSLKNAMHDYGSPSSLRDNWPKLDQPASGPLTLEEHQQRLAGFSNPATAEDNQPEVPTPPRRPAELSTPQEEPGFFDQLGNALGGIGDEIGGFFGDFGGADNKAVASDNAQPQGFDLSSILPDFSTDNSDQGSGFDLGSLFDVGEDGAARGGLIRQHHADGEFVDPQDDQGTVAEDDSQSTPSMGGQDDQEPAGQDFSSVSAPSQGGDFGAIQPQAQGVEGLGGLGDLLESIGSGLGELFGVGEAKAEPTTSGARPTGGAPDTARRLWGMPETQGRGNVSVSADDNLMADHRQLVNAVLTAPNSIALKTAQAALRANEFEINQRRLMKQQEQMYGYRQDLASQKAKAAQEKAEAKSHPMGTDVNWNLHGDEFLETLPAGYANQIRAIAEGREVIPKGIGTDEIRRAVNTYDPNFKSERFDLRKDFAKTAPSSLGGQWSSAAAGLAHALTAKEIAPSLNNSNIKLWNQFKRGALSYINDPAASAFNESITHLQEEVGKYFSGKSSTDASVRHAMERLNASSTPDEVDSNLRTVVELLQGRYEAQKDKWQRTFGDAPVENDDVLRWSPRAEEAIRTFKEPWRGGKEKPSSAPSAAPNAQQDNRPMPTPEQAAEILRKRRAGAQ